ncbi:MAG: hypothetical protein Q7N87_03280 [Candidatus Uhrbacteria bacterium]|nr:hypothetical protein [Candidatus Uhrbacteria bacterium]MDP3794051.1 hypothetical protein [Candidatus Uhrbacteria bacterium]
MTAFETVSETSPSPENLHQLAVDHLATLRQLPSHDILFVQDEAEENNDVDRAECIQDLLDSPPSWWRLNPEQTHKAFADYRTNVDFRAQVEAELRRLDTATDHSAQMPADQADAHQAAA